MGKNLGLIIFFVFIAIQVIGSIMQKQAKEKQQRELKEQRSRVAESRAQAQAQASTQDQPQRRSTPTAPPSRPSAPTTTGAAGTRETLAARRRAQLDELRQRRQSQKTSARVGGGSTVPTARPSQPRAAPIAAGQSGIDASFEALRAAEAKALRDRGRDERARAADSQRHQQELDRDDLRRKKSRAARDAAEPLATDAWAKPAARVGSGPSIGALLKDRRSLRQLIILKEILEPPLALRSSEASSS